MKQGPAHSSFPTALTDNLAQTATRSARLVKWHLWQGRLVVWLGACLLAVVIILFSKLVDHATSTFFALRHYSMWIPLLLTPGGGMLIVYCTRRYFPGAEGSGIPQTIAALKVMGNRRLERRLVAPRIIVAKVLLGSAALLCGFSSGKEGPAVQVGASIMNGFRRFLPASTLIRSDQLLLAGGAAGLAVAFNTPIAGIVFAIEELGRKFNRQTNIVLLSAIIIACAISSSYWGNFTYFGRLAVDNPSRRLLLPMLVVGVAGGVLGGIFGRLMVVGSHPSLTVLGRLRSRHPVWFAGACGLVVAILGLFSDGLAHGGGYLVTKQALENGNVLPMPFALEKMAATLVSYLSGIPGGIFAPCLAAGAAMGQEIYTMVEAMHANMNVGMDVWMALGMTAFLAGVTQVPITAFVIVMEMIDGHAMVLSLITVALISSLVAKIFSQSPYHALARGFLFAARKREQPAPAAPQTPPPTPVAVETPSE